MRYNFYQSSNQRSRCHVKIYIMKYISFVISNGRPKSLNKNDYEVHITRNFSIKDRFIIKNGLRWTHYNVHSIIQKYHIGSKPYPLKSKQNALFWLKMAWESRESKTDPLTNNEKYAIYVNKSNTSFQTGICMCF